MSEQTLHASLLTETAHLLPLIRRDAPVAEQQGHLTEAVLEAIYQLDLFRLFVSPRYQGLGADLPTSLNVFELIASADGATGWLVMIGAGGGLFSGFLPAETAASIFQSNRSVIAGSGMAGGTATPIRNGYRISGRWPYASGAYHATTFTANCTQGADKPLLSVAMPAEAVIQHDTWRAIGLQATGSHDFSVNNLSIPAQATFSLEATPYLNEPIYHCPLDTLAHASFLSVALGLVKSALNAFEQSFSLLPSDPRYQAWVDVHTHWQTNRNAFYHQVEKLWHRLTTQQGLTPTDRFLFYQACLVWLEDGLTGVDQLKRHAGMMAIRPDSDFGRAWRDLQTLSQHALLAPR
jgi:hypothetical protein